MKMFRSIVGYACLAVAAMLSCIGYASASESLTSYHFRALAFDSGSYGAESAKLKAELDYMQAINEDRTSSSTGLIAMSKHYVQAFLTKCGVAEGKHGIYGSAFSIG